MSQDPDAGKNIVAGVGVSGNSGTPGLGKMIEKAMSEAVIRCYANGKTDPESHKAAMAEARERVKKEFAAAAEDLRKKAEEAAKG